MRKAIHEILAEVRGAPDRETKIAVLRANDSYPLRVVLRYAYDDAVRWLLPEGTPPYNPLPESERIGSEQMLYKEARTMYLFVEGGDDSNSRVTATKREKLFTELLESVHPSDAEVILQAKARSIPGIERIIVHEAFPGMLRVSVAEKASSIVERVVTAVGKGRKRPDKSSPEYKASLARKRDADARRRAERRAARISSTENHQ